MIGNWRDTFVVMLTYADKTLSLGNITLTMEVQRVTPLPQYNLAIVSEYTCIIMNM
jgi:hypothetical protein